MMFIGEVQTEWVVRDRVMRLLADFSFVDTKGQTWTAPAGMLTDGASIPRVLWSIVGSPFDGSYRRAAVVHDAACLARSDPARDVHRMFHEAMLADGVGQDEAMRLYTAVRLFGPSWTVGRKFGLLAAPKVQPDIAAVEAALDLVLTE